VDDVSGAGGGGYIRFELLVHSVIVGTYHEGSNVPTVRKWQVVG
jgi:hypothetical protein